MKYIYSGVTPDEIARFNKTLNKFQQLSEMINKRTNLEYTEEELNEFHRIGGKIVENYIQVFDKTNNAGVKA